MRIFRAWRRRAFLGSLLERLHELGGLGPLNIYPWDDLRVRLAARLARLEKIQRELGAERRP